MRSCRQLKDYRFDFHTAGTFWEVPGDYRSFIFIYRLLNWISDQWGRTVCARSLSLNWNKEWRGEVGGTQNWSHLRVGLGFGGWCTLYCPDIAAAQLDSWECCYLVRTVKGKRPSVWCWKCSHGVLKQPPLGRRSLMSEHNKSVLLDLFGFLCTHLLSGVSLLGDLVVEPRVFMITYY